MTPTDRSYILSSHSYFPLQVGKLPLQP